MPDTHSVVLVKAFTYRGLSEEFSNKYHFNCSGTPTSAEWKTLMTQFFQMEGSALHAGVTLVRGYGYIPGVDHAQVAYDFTSPGPPPAGTLVVNDINALCPGDVAATIRWDTGQLNSRGKRIYCRKYMHGIFRDPASPDKVNPTQLTALNSYASGLLTGTYIREAEYCAPQGAVLSSPRADPWLTTRTLKRRGKRPLP